MEHDSFDLIQDAISKALELPPAEREESVRRACGHDERGLAEALEILAVAADHPAGSPLFTDSMIGRRREEMEQAIGSGSMTRGAGSTKSHGRGFDLDGGFGLPSGTRLGPYTILRHIGEGGMGTVYAAVQDRPRREVALKVISGGGRSVAAQRFEAEAETLGRLRHDGIAQVYGAGIEHTPFGLQPYFAMELVEGEPLDEYASSCGLGTRGKAALIARVADAMEHAHRKGVVHRDLKPENVLVTAEGQPKVLDFGIARIVGDSTLAATTMTREGQILGTLAYMAPEQLTGQSSDVDARADVYALGAMLFELVCGHPPLQVAGLSLSAALRAVEVEDPARLRSLDASIDRDIDTIVNTCLERDPTRRYGNAAALAEDLRRFLAQKPIRARPPTAAYRVTKFVRRNRLLVGGVLATVLALTVGLAGTAYYAAEERAARELAEDERNRARRSELDAVRGVLSGAQLLAQRGEPWEAVRQMMAINPSARGWEWEHASLGMPWVIEEPQAWLGSYAAGFPHPIAFVDRDRIVYVTDGGEALLLDVPTGSWRAIATDARFHPVMQPRRDAPGSLVLLDRERRSGILNVDKGVFTPVGPWGHDPVEADEGVFYGRVMSDPDSLLIRERMFITLITPGQPTLTLGGDTPDVPHTGPWWETAMPPADSPYLVLGRWALGNRAPEIVCIDRRTNRVVKTVPASHGMPLVAMSDDGARVFTRSASGFDILAVPSLERIGSVDGMGSAVSLVSLPGGGVAFVPYQARRVQFLDRAGQLTTWPEQLGESHFPTGPIAAPDGRLLLANVPVDWHPWIIDTAHPIDPSLRGVTPLAGHDSWVYQVAVSPDGSLLASAAPWGDVLLWDLRSGRLLARVRRARSTAAGPRAFHMDAPLLFDPSGESLIFGEYDPLVGRMGFSTIDLTTGARTWTGVESRAEMHDAIADRIAWTPGPLYHHATVLPGRRVLESTSAYYFPQRVVIREAPDAEDGGGEVELATNAGEIPSGVAVHPDGTHIVSGDNRKLSVRDAWTLEVIATLEDAGTPRVYGVAYSPDGERLAIATAAGAVLVYETRYYKRIAEIRPPQFEGTEPAPEGGERDYIYALAWTPDGTRLVCSGGETIRVLESERPYIRDKKREAWETDLHAAREGRPSTPEAARIISIERLARDGVIE